MIIDIVLLHSHCLLIADIVISISCVCSLLIIPAYCRGVLGDGWACRRIWPFGWGSVKRILPVRFSAEIKSILN